MSLPVKGFGGCARRGGAFRRPASESLQGRKPRLGNVWRRRGLYGDLRSAGGDLE